MKAKLPSNSIKYTAPTPLSIGAHTKVSIDLDDSFTAYVNSAKMSFVIGGLPSWLKYNKVSHVVSGISPNTDSEVNLHIYAKLGALKAVGDMQISVDDTIDSEPVIKWVGGEYNSIQLSNSAVDLHYEISAKHPLNWIHIDQNTDTLYGEVPIEEIGNTMIVTVFQGWERANPQTFELDIIRYG